jgi:Zn-dependent protease with chaperone function
MKIMLCSAATIAFAVCAVPGHCANAAPPDPCLNMRAHDKRVGAELTDPRVVNALKTVVERSGFQHIVAVCEISMPQINATAGRVGTRYYVGITKSLLAAFTDPELQAVLGHEIAHLVLGHRDPGFELTNHRASRYEQAADAVSARWFDKDAMQSALKKLRVDAAALPDASLRAKAIIEIDARIKALQ